MLQPTIGNYVILSELASGSFGRVYLAQHAVLTNRTVALKLMQNTPLNSVEERDQFIKEARILEVLHHPYILPIIDVGIHDGLPYIVSEYAAQGSLRHTLQQQQEQPLPVEVALTIIGQVGQALQYAHLHTIIHRDLKPENILFNARGEALLADFGLATMLSSSSVKFTNSAGTPYYMAPEQFQGTVSRESDQYALACIAYELFTGQHVFTAPEPVALMFQHVTATPIPLTAYNPRLSMHIEQAVLKALAKQRQDRHVDIQAFLIALGVPDELLAPASAYLPVQSLTPTDRIAAQGRPTPLPPVPTPIPPSALFTPEQAAMPFGPLTPIPPGSAPMPSPMLENLAAHTVPAYPAYQPPYQAQPYTPYPVSQPGIADSQEAITTYKQAHGPISYAQPFGTFSTQHSRAGMRRAWPLAVLILLLIVFIVAGGTWYLLLPHHQAANAQTAQGNNIAPQTQVTTTTSPTTVTVTITPVKKTLSGSYTLSAVTGARDAQQHQVAARMLSYTTPSQSQTASATGTQNVTGQNATGTVTFVSTEIYTQTIPAGTTLTTCSNAPSYYPAGSPCYGPNYLQLPVITTADAIIPIATSGPASVTVSAYVSTPGSVGNISVGMVDSTNATQTWYTNNSAFTGGMDTQSSTFVQQSDITNAENTLAQTQVQVAQSGVQAQMQANEQATGNPNCQSHTSADHAAGDKVSSFTVTATATCTLAVYDQAAAQTMAASMLVMNNADYTFATTPSAQVMQATLTDPQNGVIALAVQAQGTGIYHFSNAQKLQLAQLITDKSFDQAKNILDAQPGVASAKIAGGDMFLPSDAQAISIVIA